MYTDFDFMVDQQNHYLQRSHNHKSLELRTIAIVAAVIIAVTALGLMGSLPQNEPNIADKESQTEAEIHKLVNVQRIEHGLEPLLYDKELGKIAKAHSLDMYKRDYFAHDTPEGIELEDRGKSAGYDCRISILDEDMYYDGIFENIFKKESIDTLIHREPKSIAHGAVEWWMGSPDHRDLILHELLTVNGIGVVISENKILVTENFC